MMVYIEYGVCGRTSIVNFWLAQSKAVYSDYVEFGGTNIANLVGGVEFNNNKGVKPLSQLHWELRTAWPISHN